MSINKYMLMKMRYIHMVEFYLPIIIIMIMIIIIIIKTGHLANLIECLHNIHKP